MLIIPVGKLFLKVKLIFSNSAVTRCWYTPPPPPKRGGGGVEQF